MIYLQNNTNYQTITLPVVRSVVPTAAETVKFLLFSTVNRVQEVEHLLRKGDFNNDFNADFAIVAEPIMSDSGQFYTFTFGFESVPQVGEYEYAFAGQNSGILGRGVAIVGDYHSPRTEYGNTKEYKQYGA